MRLSKCILIVVLTLVCCVCATSSAETGIPISSSVEVGFQNEKDLFECTSADSVGLEKGEGDSLAMHWSYKYISGQYSVCTTNVELGSTAGLVEMQFRIRSNVSRPIWIQVNEVNGEGYYQVINASPSWSRISLKLTDLAFNGSSSEGKRLNVEKISKIIVIDANALSGGGRAGTQSLWFSNWKFVGSGKGRGEASLSARESHKPIREVSATDAVLTGKVGLSAIPRNWQDTEKGWRTVFQRARELNVQMLSACGGNWSEIERSPGTYDWSSMERYFSAMDKYGYSFRVSCDFPGVFFHDGQKQLPKEVRNQALDDKDFLKRYTMLLNSYLDRFGSRTDYIVIHAEGAYNYFRGSPARLDAYLKFLSRVKQAVQVHSPHIQVGVNTDPHNEDSVLTRLASVLDFMGYDILRIEDHLEQPGELDVLVKRLVRLAGDKKIAFQNAGWSTSKVGNGSEDQQVEFIKQLYRVLDMYRGQIEFANYYYLYDEDLEFMRPVYKAMFPDSPEWFREKMVQSNGRFGVLRADGSMKPGFHELKKQIALYLQKGKS